MLAVGITLGLLILLAATFKPAPPGLWGFLVAVTIFVCGGLWWTVELIEFFDCGAPLRQNREWNAEVLAACNEKFHSNMKWVFGIAVVGGFIASGRSRESKKIDEDLKEHRAKQERERAPE